MKYRASISAAALFVIAGTAIATPPTTDGVLSPGEYPWIRWSQNVATQFGDNVANSGCSDSAVGNPGAVTTGLEFNIPLTALGSPTGDIRVCAFLNSQGHDGVSNQIMGGIPAQRLGLGEPRNVSFLAIANDQYVTAANSAGASPVIDGTLDAGVYGAVLATQTCRTSFGDSTSGDIANANGSELDNISAVVRNGSLYIFIGGNLSADFTKLELFIDTGTGNGYSSLPTGLPDVDFHGLERLADDGSGNGLIFDAGFTADYYITFGLGGSPATFYPNFADLNNVSGWYLGSNTPGNGGTLSGGTNPDLIEIAIDNTNTAGVPAACPQPTGDVDEASGSELDNVWATVDETTHRLYIFIGGNLQTNYNRLDLFIDCTDGGQNTIGTNPADSTDVANPNCNYDSLASGKLKGLTFDSDFAADYYITVSTFGANPTNMYVDACVLRSDGQFADGSGFPYDYGSYSGGAKPVTPPHVTFSGTLMDAQDGNKTHIYSNYPPRIGGNRCYDASPLAPDPDNPFPIAGLLKAALNNSNIDGVGAYPDGDTCSGVYVTTGFEMEIDLDELGWDGYSLIKLAGYVASPDHTYMSNQVIGGLPAGTANLATSSAVNFETIAGKQYVFVNICPSDYDKNGFVNGDDFDFFSIDFEAGSPSSDFDWNCFPNGDDYDYFSQFFVNGC